MEGKVLFILKSLSLVNHGRLGLDWRRITSAPSAGTNAIIPLLVPSLSVHPNAVRHNETDPEGHSRGPIQNTLLQLPSPVEPTFLFFFVLSGHCNVEKNVMVPANKLYFLHGLQLVDTEMVSPTDPVHPITPPSCWILHSYLCSPLGAACNGTL